MAITAGSQSPTQITATPSGHMEIDANYNVTTGTIVVPLLQKLQLRAR